MSRHLLISINLSNYGMGDAYGTCLGQGLSALPNLAVLRLHDNRLTSTSIHVIIQGLACTTIKHLDLSKNDLRGKGIQTLGSYFKFEAASTGTHPNLPYY